MLEPRAYAAQIVVAEVSYSPVLLLDARLGASITDDPDFCDCCQLGFEVYFDFLPSDGIVADVMMGFVVNNLVDSGDGVMPLPSAAGLVLGWLSALALTDRSLASQGLDLLITLANVVVSH
jgi:hypothetical protein